jgi:DeoR/GlpR family transcriptional regulator of sugar metabolism
VIVPIDHSKIGVFDFARVCEPRDIDIIVTHYADDRLKQICKDHAVKLKAATAQPSA